MGSRPELKTKQLLDAIVGALDEDVISDFQRAKILRDAKALMDLDAGAAHMVFGALACVDFDFESMHYHHKLSIQLKPQDYQTRCNYSVSLERAGFIQESIDILGEAVMLAPEDVGILARLFDKQYHGLRFSGAKETANLLRARAPNFDLSRYTDIGIFEKMLMDWGWSEDYLCMQVDFAFELLRTHRARCLAHELFAVTEFQDSSIYLSLHIKAELDKVSAVADDLYVRMDEAFEDWNPARLSITIEPSHVSA